MRLPIYRRLDEEFRLLGLSIKQLILVGGIFVGLGEVFSFWQYGRAFSVCAAATTFFALQILNRRMESYFLEKLIRFLEVPSALGRKAFDPSSLRNGQNYEKQNTF